MPQKKEIGRLITAEGLRESGIEFSPSQLNKLIMKWGFPAPIRLGGRKRFWVEEEINKWIALRKNQGR